MVRKELLWALFLAPFVKVMLVDLWALLRRKQTARRERAERKAANTGQ
jgi:hypothetical protein